MTGKEVLIAEPINRLKPKETEDSTADSESPGKVCLIHVFRITMISVILLLSHFLLSSEAAISSTSNENFIESRLYIEAKDCGPDDKSIIFHSASVLPDPIIYPGNVVVFEVCQNLNLICFKGSVKIQPDMEIIKDVPAEKLMMKLSLQKLEPQRMTIPCLNGMGSW